MVVVFPEDKKDLDVMHGTAVALGNFDGLHRGHIELINRIISICKSEKLKSVVYTFANHPENVIASKTVTPLITTNDAKVKILSGYELNYLYFEEFNEGMMKMSPEDFVYNILVKKFNVKYIVVGFDYRFGHKGQGNTELLKELGSKYGFEVEVIKPVKIDETIVSSSIIRDFIKQGEVDRAMTFLNRSYSILGEVVVGKRLGNKLGFPTINIHPNPELVIPSKGVYITMTKVSGQTYPSVTNVGNNPTVGDNEIRIETHILDFDDDLYGSKTEILFLKRVRDEKKFSGITELSRQINHDVMCARQYFMNQGIYNKMNIC